MIGAKSTEKRGARFNILYQILLTMCIIALIPLGGLWYISIYKSKIDWTANIKQNLISRTDALTQSIDAWTDMNLRVLEQNAKTPGIQSLQSSGQNPVLTAITDTYKWIYLAFTVAPDGENIGRSDGKPTRPYGDRLYFKQVMRGDDIGEQVLIGKTSKKPAFILAKAIKDDIKNTLGVIAIAMDLEDLSRTVTKTRIGRTGYAILLDANNRLIAHGRGKIASTLQDFSSHPALKNRSSGDFVFEEKGKKIVAYTNQTKQGWTLIVQQDYKEAYHAANMTQRNAFILLGITFLIVIIVAYLLARRLSTPIRKLTDIANEISRGKGLKNKLVATSNDEIGDLYQSFELMRKSVVKLIKMVRKSK